MKKIKISEAQFNAINEMVNEGGEQFDVAVNKQAGQTTGQALEKTAQTLRANGIGANKVHALEVDAEDAGLSESYFVSGQQIKESRRKYLQENSNVYGLNDFIKQLKK